MRRYRPSRRGNLKAAGRGISREEEGVDMGRGEGSRGIWESTKLMDMDDWFALPAVVEVGGKGIGELRCVAAAAGAGEIE